MPLPAFRTGRPTLAGIVFIQLCAVLLSPVAAGSVKFLAADFAVLEIVWIRAIGQTFWMLVLFVPRHG